MVAMVTLFVMKTTGLRSGSGKVEVLFYENTEVWSHAAIAELGDHYYSKILKI